MRARAKFESQCGGRCIVLTQPNGKIREFHIPYTSSGEGYIREGSDMGPQICNGLVYRGSTLRATPETLGTVIRREWAKYRQSEWYESECCDDE